MSEKKISQRDTFKKTTNRKAEYIRQFETLLAIQMKIKRNDKYESTFTKTSVTKVKIFTKNI